MMSSQFKSLAKLEVVKTDKIVFACFKTKVYAFHSKLNMF